uniref:outer membrane protein assembly factor BamB family protein n=1 Tax=Tahibacter sp. TaxID=2056211 RepID=UPI0028C4BBB1
MPYRFKTEKEVVAAYRRLSAAEGGEPLGATDQQRLMQLASLIQPDGRINTLDALQALYGKTDTAAEANFRKLASRLNSPQDEPPVLLLHLGGKEPLPQRHCWLEGDAPNPDDGRQLLAEQTRRETGRVAQQTAAQDAMPLEAEPKPDTPVPVRIFVSYAHADNQGAEKECLVDRLMKDLMPVLRGFGNQHGYEVRHWQDHRIICDGAGWDAQIQQAIQESDLGLLFVSHHFLDRNYIVQNELPYFLPDRADATGVDDRWMVGVQLKSLRWGAVGKLKERQLFSYKVRNRTQSYQDCRSKENFAAELAEAIHKSILRRLPVMRERLEPIGKQKKLVETNESDIQSKRRTPLTHLAGYDDRLQDPKADADAAPTPIQTQDDSAAPDRTNAKPVAQLLDDWLDEADGAPYFALLGETGTGKTTQCQLLAIRRNSAWKADPAKPQCIYLDLRRVGSDIHAYRSDMRALLNHLLRQGWTGDGEPPVADDVLRVVRDEGALVIWDGLDEVGVHLTNADQLNRLMTTLWSVLPLPEKHSDGRYRIPGAHPGRILISCRSQFFRDARLQNQVLLGLGREGLGEQCFAGATLLPLTEEQVRHYFEVSLPDQDIEALMAMIASVHNLTELSQRAMTLNLIREQIPRLQQAQLRGERISGVTLYRNFAESWLSRDIGKHNLEPRHKLALMQALAAQLWKRSARSWSVDELDDWFAEALEQDSALSRHYRNKDLEPLKADLRTATFVQREGERRYRFAHTSLLEYFLAGYLLTALQHDQSECWAMGTPSAETWDFFAQHLQLLETAELHGLMARLTAWGQGDVRAVNENLWSYAIRALSRNWPVPSLRGLNLPNLRADGIRLHARAGHPLDLRDAVMRGLSMHGAWLRHIDWRGADLSDANLTQANLEYCDLSGANMTAGLLQRSRWYESAASDMQLNRADTTSSLWVSDAGPAPLPITPVNGDLHAGKSAVGRVNGHRNWVLACALSADGSRLYSASEDLTLKAWDAASGRCLATFAEHERGGSACALSADGNRLYSASQDRTLKAWDVASGRCLATFTGHKSGVTACALSADGSRLYSASQDRTLRAWDVASGRCLATFTGHDSAVTACALSADGSRLYSASNDWTLKAWDVATDRCLATFTGHESKVLACALLADGSQLYSASQDRTLKAWDVASGNCLATFVGHESMVLACALSADGSRLYSASDDGTLKAWDAASGRCLVTLTGHQDWVRACALSADGSRLYSASDDGTLKAWDVASGRCLATFKGHESMVLACALSADGSRLYSASDDGTLRAWDVASGRCLATFKGHES